MKTTSQARHRFVDTERHRGGHNNRRPWLRRGLLGALLLVMMAAPALGGTPNSDNTPRALEPLGNDTDSFATDINNRGQASGRSEGTTTTAVRWDRNGNATPLYPLQADRDSFGEAINNGGEVVGISRSGEDPCVRPADLLEIFKDTAVVWDRHGRRRVLSPLAGDVETRGYGINNRGIAVGISLGPRRPSDCGASFTAVIWDREGNPTPRPSPSSVLDEGFGYDINNNGVVAGFINDLDGTGFAAAVWSRQGVPTVLPGLGAGFDFGIRLNDSGAVAGVAFDPAFTITAVIWDRRGNLTTLPPYGSDGGSSANDINSRGQVVGSSFGAVETAVVWDKHGEPTVLRPLGNDTDSSGIGINDPGHVVGNSSSAAGPTTAVVWRPRR